MALSAKREPRAKNHLSMSDSSRTSLVNGELTRGESFEDAYAKVTWRILPFLFICYVFAYLDRVNIGFAKLQIQHELGLTETVYGMAAGIFFLGYVLFEIPSNLLLARTGARRTLSRILILWGLTSSCMMFVQGAPSFYILRFALGVFEAGFAPGMLFYLTLWYSSAQLTRVSAMVLLAAPVASLLGGPVSGWIMSSFHGNHELSGWQWMFLAEGAPAVVLGVIALLILRDSPSEANWLSESERRLIQLNLDAHTQSKQESFVDALQDSRVYQLAIICFCIISGIYTVSFWLPSLLNGAGVASVLQIGLYSAIPYAATVVAMIVLARRFDARAEHGRYVAGLMFAGALSLAATALTVNSLWLGLLSITLTTCFLWCALSIFWSIPSEFLKGTAAAGGIALINSVGLLGGFVSPSVIGFCKTLTGSFAGGLWVMVAILVTGGLLLLRAPSQIKRSSGTQ